MKFYIQITDKQRKALSELGEKVKNNSLITELKDVKDYVPKRKPKK